MLKYLEEKVINHCFWDVLLFLFLSFFWLTFVIVRIDCQKIHCPVFYQTAGLKETLLLWASFSSQVWQALAELFCAAFVALLSDIWGFRCSGFFWGVFFLEPLMYLFDLCGKAICLGFSSTTNVRLKIILFALKSLHLMYTILLCFWEIKIKTKDKQAGKITQATMTNNKEIQRFSCRVETGHKENAIF